MQMDWGTDRIGRIYWSLIPAFMQRAVTNEVRNAARLAVEMAKKKKESDPLIDL